MGLISRVSSRTYRFDKMTEASITTTTSQKFKNLSESINSEFNKNKQTALYLQAKQDVMNIIQNVAKLTKTGKDYPNISLWLQGSSVNGFATKGSDADIVLMTGDHKDHPKEVVGPAAFDEDKELKGSWAVEKSSEVESEDLDIEEDEKVKKEKQDEKKQAKFDVKNEKRRAENEKKDENRDENGVAREKRGSKEKKGPRDNRLTKDNFADKGDPVAKKKKLLSNIVEFQVDSRRRSNATDAEDESSSEFSEIELSAKKSVSKSSKSGKKRVEKIDKLDDEKNGHQLNDQTKKVRKLQDENKNLRKQNKKLQQDFITFKNKSSKNLDQKIKLIKKLQAELEEMNLKNEKHSTSGKTQFETEFKTVLNQN